MGTRILLADDHAIVLDGLEAVLKLEPGLSIVAKVTDANMGLSYLKMGGIDLVITDYSMPGMDGLSFIKKIKESDSSIKIIMLSMHDEPHIVKEVLSAGADGYILKKYAQQELVYAIRSVMEGRQYWSQEVSRALIRNISDPSETQHPLTERETEVLKLLAEELSSKEIAIRLFISERTVETHRKNLMRKINATNTVGLIKYAYANKLL